MHLSLRINKAHSVVISLSILFSSGGCNKRSHNEFRNNPLLNDGTDLPVPVFDEDLGKLLISFKKRFNAESIKIDRPYEFDSTGTSRYWLRVFLLNPDIQGGSSDPFAGFAEDVATNTYIHLTNPERFERIEIAVKQSAGTIVSFSSKMSKFLWRDSLRFASPKVLH